MRCKPGPGAPWIAAALILASAPVAAQPVKVGFVDTERIVRHSPAARDYQQRLEREFAPRDQQLQQRAQRLAQLRRDYERGAAAMNEGERRAKAREIDTLDRDLNRANSTFQEDLSVRRNEMMAELSRRTDRAVQQVMQDERYDMVLQFVLYWHPRVDITERVLRLLDAGHAGK